MSTCAICLDALKVPMSLPCGHVYCHACISDTIKVVASSTSSLAICCPTCREPVSTVTPNPLFVPSHLRPYILPPFRRIYLNVPASTPGSTDSDPALDPSPEDVEKVTSRLHMENAALRQSCHAWRARANAHVGAHLGLSALVRLAQDQTRVLKDERDELSRKYDALKRKFSDVARESGLDVPESDEDEEESVLVWTVETSPSSKPLDEVEIGTRAPKSGDVPCVSPTEVSPVSGPEAIDEPRGKSKRRKLSPVAPVYSDTVEKSATSIPAMVIPHLVSPRPVAPTGPTILDT